jgi:dipeptidyl aminopeptidase/acylaminoacyl peptidase
VLERARLGLALLAVILVLSCGGDSGSGEPTGTPSFDGAGKLIFTLGSALVEFDIATGEETPLVQLDTPNSFLLDPAVSRDGTQLAYVQQPPAQVIDGRYDAGTDLWIANRDGSGGRMLYRHTQPNALVRYPRWTPDGDVIAIIQEIEETTRITEVAYTVQRIDVESGARTKLLDDAYSITVSPDGSRMAYARPLMEGGERFESIALDDPAGAPAVLVAPSENLLPFNSPQYSPDGTSIAFASADQTAAPPPPPAGRLLSRAGGHAGPPLQVAAPVAAMLDGLPQDIWLVDAAGGRPSILATMQEDLPSLTWSGDGEHVYVLGGTGLYDVNVVSFAVTRIGEGVFHGQIAWAR